MSAALLDVSDDLRVAHVIERHVVRNDASEVQLLDRGVERDHSVLGVRLHDAVDLMRLRLANEVADRRVVPEHLAREHAAFPVGARQQPLRNHREHAERELDSDLLLLSRGEHVDYSIDRLDRIVRVQRAEHQVAGFRGGQRRGNSLQVAHLSDQYDVGVLPEDVFQRAGERERVAPQLALVDDRLLMMVDVLYGVLDGDDVATLVRVDEIYHRGLRGRLAVTRGPGDEDQSLRPERQLGNDLGQAEFLQGGHLLRNGPHGGGDAALLHVYVDPETVAA